MERTYRAANGIFIYAALLILTAALLGFEAWQRLSAGAPAWGVGLAILAAAWLGCAMVLLAKWGRLRITVRSDAIAISGDGPERRLNWSDIYRVRELRGPAYQLSLRGLLPGPYLPLGLIRGETVLELSLQPASRLVLRQALIHGYVSLRQDIAGSVSRETEVDLHARWWRDDEEPHGDLLSGEARVGRTALDAIDVPPARPRRYSDRGS